MPPKIPVIIDTDPGVDDVIAILLALASPEIEVLAIIVSYGNTDVKACWKNIFRLYRVLALHFEKYPEDRARFPNFAPTRKIILAKGADKPIQGEGHYARYFHGRDGLGELGAHHPDLVFEGIENDKNHPQLEISTKSGVDVALEIIRGEEARSVTYIALGPLTDLALMMRKDPATVRDRLGRICSMGGALDVPGNTSPVSEFNYFADPYAVSELLTPKDPSLGIPLERFLLVPLDITKVHEFPFPVYKARVDNSFESGSSPSDPSGKSPLNHLTSSFLERAREHMLRFGKDSLVLHDPVAVWCAIQNPPAEHEVRGQGPALQLGWKASMRVFQVERTGEITRGMLVVDRRDKEGASASGKNRAYAQEELSKLSAGHQPVAIPARVEVEGSVAVVVQTPGQDAIMELLLRRIWGV